ncbi:MAG: diguanylate cyclase, partial [Bacilli bacterium]|nr:diguanylate cyclase [Bacilli bacterium]
PYALLKVKMKDGDFLGFSFVEINELFSLLFQIPKKTFLKRKGKQVFTNNEEEYLLWKSFCENAILHKQKTFSGFSTFLNSQYFVKVFLINKNTVLVVYEEHAQNEMHVDFTKKPMTNKEMTLIIGMDYQIIYASSGALSLVGYSADEIKQKSIFSLVSSNSINLFMNFFENDELISGKGSMNTIEVELITKSHQVVKTEQHITYLWDLDKQVSGVLSSIKLPLYDELGDTLMTPNEERLQAFLDTTEEGIYAIDLHGNIIFCNHNCVKVLGYNKKEDLIGKNSHLLIHHHNMFNQILPVKECQLHQVFKTGNAVRSDKDVFWRKDGSNFSAEFFANPLVIQDKVEFVVVSFCDISARKLEEKILKEQARSHRVLLANLPGLAYKCSFDRDWTMQFVSEGCFELTGHKPESLLNNRDLSYNDLIAPEFQEHLWEVWVAAVKNHTPIREEYILITASGKRKWVLEQGQPIYSETGVVESLEGLVLDISDQKIKQLEVQYMSQHDVLTGLFNRAFFEKELTRFNNTQYLPLSIIIGDINGLKLTNDAFGHDEGDRLIQKTAEIIKSCVRSDDVVARTGGDEFTILLPNTDSETAYYYLKKIQAKCEQDKNDLHDTGTVVSFSLGFATKEKTNENISSIQKIAEDFMYKRKLLERSSLHSSFISSITATMFEKSQETEEHAARMRELSVMLGQNLGLMQKELDELSLLATLHDIGKVSIDRKILNKPGKLNEEEWMEIKKHPEIGYRITKASPELSSIAEYVLSHHERWDGTGYPQGLKEKAIPLLARIISIVDAYDAMTNERSYRKTKTPAEALNEIKANAGTQFDPNLAYVFVQLMEKEISE